jgi:hypothetical protein
MPDQNAELSYEDFARARKLYWQPGVKCIGNGALPPNSDSTSLVRDGSDFMLYSAGPPGIFAVFEDFDQKGWFYLYDARQQKILKSAYVYNRANVAVVEDVIDIGWAADDSSCGLAVWGEFRAFLGISNDVHIERPLTSADEDGIPSAKWPAGFELYLEKKMD